MKILLSIFTLTLVLTGCQLITEPDLSNSEVYLLAPKDSLVTTNGTHTLWWEHVSDAELYNVQVVSPGWNEIEYLIADTNLSGNKFNISLPPGEYDWGVSAYNSSSATAYSVAHLKIDTSSSLVGQLVVLKSPENNSSTNKLTITFEWYELDAADSYIFDIRIDNWQGPGYVPQQVTSGTSTTVELSEGVYEWGVKGFNDNSSTAYSTRLLYIDQTPPGKPTITNPKFHGDTLEQNNALITWTRPETSVSPISDSLMVSVDSLFREGTPVEVFITTGTEYLLTGFSTGKYFCRVRSFDAAGNVGALSATRKFYIE
jgi:hypothetical protein